MSTFPVVKRNSVYYQQRAQSYLTVLQQVVDMCHLWTCFHSLSPLSYHFGYKQPTTLLANRTDYRPREEYWYAFDHHAVKEIV